jgi:hypothetical protein
VSRRGPGRLPGDPRPGDRGFGALGGFVDDTFFWIRNRERSGELEQDRLGRLGRPARSARSSFGLGRRLRATLRRLVRRR